MGKLILSAFADEYDNDFETQLKALKEFGIDHLEIRFVNGKNVSALTDKEIAEVKTLLKKYGIKISAIGSPLGKIRLDEDMDAHMELTERVCAIAKELDAKYVRMFSFYPPNGKRIEECREEVLEALKRMLDIADRYGVMLCHENEARIYGETAQNCLDVIEALQGRLRAVLDMGNFTLEGHDPINAYSLLKDKIEYFHIKDGFKGGIIVPAGKGDAKIEEILSSYVKDYDRDVFVTLEPHLLTFDGLKDLTEVQLKNPYKYKDQHEAFVDAVDKFKEILIKI